MTSLTLILFVSIFIAYASAVPPGGKCKKYLVKTFFATARNAEGLTHIVEDFRTALGGEDNLSAPGPLDEGHRSINWDAAAVPFDMPFDFFDQQVTRGAIFKAEGEKFAVSNPATRHPKDDRFSSLLPRSASRQFKRFSLDRLFTPVLDNTFAIVFSVPGTDRNASTTGFGAVFTDVDLKHVTGMKFLDKSGCDIAKIFVPPKSKGLSFAGLVVLDKNEINKSKKTGRKDAQLKLYPGIGKVVIRLGNISVDDFANRKKSRGRNDLVVLDDFIYGEPEEQPGGYRWGSIVF